MLTNEHDVTCVHVNSYLGLKMIDTIRIWIPLKMQYISQVVDKQTGKITGGECDLNLFRQFGCTLAAGQTSLDENGNLEVHRLYHPFESIPSSNSSLAYKIRAGGANYFPHIELNASAAKMLTGHNAFGSTNFETCISSLLYVFHTQFQGIQEVLDYSNAEVLQMDFTYTAHVENIFVAKQVIEALRHVSSGQIRLSKESYKTSVMWNAGSEHCVRLAYLKHFEIKRQIEELTRKQKTQPNDYQKYQLEQLKSEAVQNFAENAVRFEAKMKKRKFKSMGIPTRIVDLIEYAESFKGDLAQHLWNENFKDILSTFEGAHVNVYNDDEVFQKLKEHYATTTPSGNVSYAKANRIFRFFRDIKNEGFAEVKRVASNGSFYRNLDLLTAVVPRAYLQNLHSVKSNIIPLVRLVNVDFSNQHPQGWQEPVHMSQQLDNNLTQPLRLVG